MDKNLLSQVRWLLERFKGEDSVDSREEQGIDEVLKQLEELASSLRVAAEVIYDNLPDPEFEEERREGERVRLVEEERRESEKIGDKLQSLSRNSDEPDPWKVG